MKDELLKALTIAQAASVPCILKAGAEVDFVLAALEGSEEMVNVPLGLFLDCVHLLRGTAENYRVPVELVKAMRMALYKMGDYSSEAHAGELYRLIEWKEKSDGSNS